MNLISFRSDHFVLSDKCWGANLVPGTPTRPTSQWGDRQGTIHTFYRSWQSTFPGAGHCSGCQGYNSVNNQKVISASKKHTVWKCSFQESTASLPAGWLQDACWRRRHLGRDLKEGSELLQQCLRVSAVIERSNTSLEFSEQKPAFNGGLTFELDHKKITLNESSSSYMGRKCY